MEIINYIKEKIIVLIGKVHWKTNNVLNEDELKKIHDLLIKDYYIILTRRSNHLSTFFVGLANFYLTGKWGYWSHVLMNLEDQVDIYDDFRLIEATGSGVHYTPFDEVFDVQDAALLKPKSMTVDKWTSILDRAKEQLGKPYDTLFDIKDSKALSCVELVRFILQGEPNYETDFANFESLIKKYKNLSPQMFFDCSDFELVDLSKI